MPGRLFVSDHDAQHTSSNCSMENATVSFVVQEGQEFTLEGCVYHLSEGRLRWTCQKTDFSPARRELMAFADMQKARGDQYQRDHQAFAEELAHPEPSLERTLEKATQLFHSRQAVVDIASCECSATQLSLTFDLDLPENQKFYVSGYKMYWDTESGAQMTREGEPVFPRPGVEVAATKTSTTPRTRDYSMWVSTPAIMEASTTHCIDVDTKRLFPLTSIHVLRDGKRDMYDRAIEEIAQFSCSTQGNVTFYTPAPPCLITVSLFHHGWNSPIPLPSPCLGLAVCQQNVYVYLESGLYVVHDTVLQLVSLVPNTACQLVANSHRLMLFSERGIERQWVARKEDGHVLVVGARGWADELVPFPEEGPKFAVGTAHVIVFLAKEGVQHYRFSDMRRQWTRIADSLGPLNPAGHAPFKAQSALDGSSLVLACGPEGTMAYHLFEDSWTKHSQDFKPLVLQSIELLD